VQRIPGRVRFGQKAAGNGTLEFYANEFYAGGFGTAFVTLGIAEEDGFFRRPAQLA
jgi:hypothetical protein